MGGELMLVDLPVIVSVAIGILIADGVKIIVEHLKRMYFE